MAQIQRPSKQGGSTTYQGKVAAGYTKILASEMDADLDTIYSAWNTGVDASNITPGSITGDKLAPGAVGTRELADLGVKTGDLGDGQVSTSKLGDLQVTSGKLADGAVNAAKLDPALKLPINGLFPLGLVSLTPRMSLVAATTYCEVQGNSSSSPQYDTAKASWLERLDYATDVWQLWHTPPGATPAWTQPLTVGANGDVTAAGFSNFRGRAGAASLAAAIGPLGNGAGATLPLVAWIDTGGLYDAGAGGLHAPTFDCWAAINATVSISVNGGLGFAINIEENTSGSTWTTIASTVIPMLTTALTVSTVKPLTANRRFRLSVFNGTGVNVTITYGHLAMMVLGST